VPSKVSFTLTPEQEYIATLIQEKFKLTPRQQAKKAYEDYLASFDLKGLIVK
jgi:hypothetical protein